MLPVPDDLVELPAVGDPFPVEGDFRRLEADGPGLPLDLGRPLEVGAMESRRGRLASTTPRPQGMSRSVSDPRSTMRPANLDVLPQYPEDRECKAPTANRILEVFENIQRHDLMAGGTVYKCFEPQLTALQEELLQLLEVPRARHGLAACGTGR